jgi:hypothetical protein
MTRVTTGSDGTAGPAAPVEPQRPPPAPGGALQGGEIGFRYGGVLLLSLAVVVFLIAAPADDWSRAVGLGLEFTALIVVVITSNERERVRRHRALATGAAAAVVVIAVGVGAVPASVTFAIAALVAFMIPASLLGGLIKLIRRKGVTIQVVAGALAIYLLIGLVFAFAIGFAVHVGAHPYFAQGGDGTMSERVYYSFTVLTTTGFGDFTAGHSGGRSIAVLEMLIGQLYLVTVIGVLVGDIAGRRRGADS